MHIESIEVAGRRAMPVTARASAPSDTLTTAPPIDPDLIGELRWHYRAAKSAEDTRNRLMAGCAAFVRVFVSGWEAGLDPAERKRTAAQALRVVKNALKDQRPYDENGKPLCALPEPLKAITEPQAGDAQMQERAAGVIGNLPAPWWGFHLHVDEHKRAAEQLLKRLPIASSPLLEQKGVSMWSLITIIAEAGDLVLVPERPGVRTWYKRFGLAPDECYERGEAKHGREGGRKIPRARRGRIMGIIAEPLGRAQWRGERKADGSKITKDSERGLDGNLPAHPIGPFGTVYGEAKARHLAAGKTKLHADKLARRAMVKALIHDAHRAWHGQPLDYVVDGKPSRPGNPDRP